MKPNVSRPGIRTQHIEYGAALSD